MGWEWFARNPHLLMPLGFVEYRGFRSSRDLYKWAGMPHSDGVLASGHYQSAYKDKQGHWWWLLSACTNDRYIDLVPVSDLAREENELDDIGEFAERYSLDELLHRLQGVSGQWLEDEVRFQFPDPHLYGVRDNVRLELLDASSRLLEAVRNNKFVLDLRSMHWKQLEELVANLLCERGLQVYPVKCNPQGGRDLIAQGRLFPDSDPITIAVEVKHRQIVGRPVLATALSQNRLFPAIMLVTSGRFTSGVIMEKHAPDNHFRLFLKDGESLESMIRNPFKDAIDP